MNKKQRDRKNRKRAVKVGEMKMNPITYYLTLSQVFPSTHCRAGEPTGFRDSLRKTKLHTIRANYDFWARRFEKILDGEAVLSIREWVGKPYGKGSTQREIARLTRDDGIGLQRLTVAGTSITTHPIFVDSVAVSSATIAQNDGLTESDWLNWFADYKIEGPLAVIQFTKFRYQ